MKKALIIAACIVIAIPVVVIISFPVICNQKKKELINQHQTTINDIDKIALTGENPAQKAEVFASPRCPGQLTGEDFISVQKTYSTTMNGGAAVDAIRTNLTNAGYKISNEYFGVNWGCKLIYNGGATKGDTTLGFAAVQKNLSDPNCTNKDTFAKTTEAYFREQNIDSVTLIYSS